MKRRAQGTGGLFQLPGSPNWYIAYYHGGKQQRESTKTTNKTKAGEILKERLAACGNGTLPQKGKTTIRELVEDFLAAGRENKQRSVADSEARWNHHLKPVFAHVRATALTTDMLRRYREKRKTEPVLYSGNKDMKTGRGIVRYPLDSTINRELSVLRAAYNLGRKCTPPKVVMIPSFPMVSEADNIREGFLKDEVYFKLAEECGKIGLWLRGLFEVAASYAWRSSEAAVKLKVSQVDLRNRTILLAPKQTKNRSGRVVKMTERIYQLVNACCMGKSPADLVFTRSDGRPAGQFRTAWKNACTAAGVPELKFHDLRRTGARNMRRLGIAENVIMKIGGWKTPSVFRRYNIVDEADLIEASEKIEQRQRELEAEYASSKSKVNQVRQNQPSIIN